MTYINLDSAKRLGHSIIDDDHKAMIDRVNSLVDLLTMDAGERHREALIVEAIEALHAATVEHYRAEEAIMAMAGYPLLECHRRQHQDLIAEFMRFAPIFCSPQPDMALQTIDFLRDWNAYHVKVWDAPLVSWLNDRAEMDGGSASLMVPTGKECGQPSVRV